MALYSSILIKNVLYEGKLKDIYIENNLINEISDKINLEGEFVINGRGKAILPGFINTHTHSAMTLLRGYSDDLPLSSWLEKIWVVEEKLTEEDVYWGAKLACLEMIKTGTTTFNDMYWFSYGTAKAANEMGLRAVISPPFIDMNDTKKAKVMKKDDEIAIGRIRNLNSNRIKPSIGPHAIYTVSPESLQMIKEWADRDNLLIHIHLSETQKEIIDCKKEHDGLWPVEYLESLGFLGENLICAHSIWLSEHEIDLLKKYDVKITHCPTSNMKLSSGILPYGKLVKKGITVSLGTDGSASNNNLDMFSEMKFASLLQKINTSDPTVMPSNEAFSLATINGAKALNINSGKIMEGKLADIILIDLKKDFMTPDHNFLSNVVYSANGSCVTDTICDGRILMQDRVIDGEKEIIEKTSELSKEILKR